MRNGFQSLRLLGGLVLAASVLVLTAFDAMARQSAPVSTCPLSEPGRAEGAASDQLACAPNAPSALQTPPPVMISPAPSRDYQGPPVVVPGPPPPPYNPDSWPPRPSVVTSPGWGRSPMPEYPEQAMSSDIEQGSVTVNCTILPNGRLADCRILSETPSGVGFGRSALDAASLARVTPRTVDMAAVGARVQFTVRFRMAPEPPRLSVIEDPAWARSPRPAFPQSARNAGIASARVRLDCEIVRGNGRLRNCVVKEEDPEGHRFGAAAIRATRDASIDFARYHAADDAHAVFTVTFAD